MAGCGGSKSLHSDETPAMPSKPVQEWKAPEWVTKGSGAFRDEKGKAFFGVGVSSESKNYATLWETANVRARNEVATVFQVYLASLTKDYLSHIGDVTIRSSEDQVLWERAIKQVTSITLNGVEIVDRWQHPETMTMFTLARLDLDSFKNKLDRMKELDARVRTYIRKNSDRLFDELEKEEDKIRQAEGNQLLPR